MLGLKNITEDSVLFLSMLKVLQTTDPSPNVSSWPMIYG